MSDVLGPSTLAISSGIGLFQGFLPKLTEVRRGNAQDPEFASDVHLGELAAITMLVGIGLTTSTLTGSHVPLVVSVGTAFLLFLIYEYTLNTKGEAAA